ncbi:MAG: hypothetical protein QOC92_3119 [Acidimicrobiaceae bacterium]|jgi:hypothetical protein
MDRSPRLAELVVHLTGCVPIVAVDAVADSARVSPHGMEDPLAIVARAMCSVRRLDLTAPVDLRETKQVNAS